MNTYQAPTVCQEILYFYFSFYSHFNPRREVLLCPSTLQMKELRLREVMWQAQAPAAMSWRAGILMKADQQWSQCPPKLLSIATPGRPFPPIKECRISSPSTISSATSPPSPTLLDISTGLSCWHLGSFPLKQLFLETLRASHFSSWQAGNLSAPLNPPPLPSLLPTSHLPGLADSTSEGFSPLHPLPFRSCSASVLLTWITITAS